MAAKKKAGRRDRKNVRFNKLHPNLPINLVKNSSRTAWAKKKRELKTLKKSV